MKVLTICALFAVPLAWPSMSAYATEWSKEDFITNHETALLIEVGNSDNVDGYLYANHSPRKEFTIIRLELKAGSLSDAADHFSFSRRDENQTLIAYALRPSASSSMLIWQAEIEAKLVNASPIPDLSEITTEPGLTIYKEGLTRVLAWNDIIPGVESLDLDGLGKILVSRPEMVAFRLPEGFTPEAFRKSGSMAWPPPENIERQVSFSVKANNQIRVKYSLPEPAIIEELANSLNKIVTPLMGIILLVFSQFDKIDRIRWKRAAIFCGVIVIIINGFYLYRAHLTGEGFAKAWVDILLVFVFAFLTWLSFFVMKKSSAEPHVGPGAKPLM